MMQQVSQSLSPSNIIKNLLQKITPQSESFFILYNTLYNIRGEKRIEILVSIITIKLIINMIINNILILLFLFI